MPRLKLLIFGTLSAGVFILFSLAQETNRRWQYQQEVRRLEEDVAEVEKSTIALEHLNHYFRTDEYQERLAREKLNYRAPGEKVVLIPHEQALETPIFDLNAIAPEHIPVPVRWWQLFFGQ